MLDLSMFREVSPEAVTTKANTCSYSGRLDLMTLDEILGAYLVPIPDQK
jgi:hypothetical protein